MEEGVVFVSLTDEDGEEHILEYVSSVEWRGSEYRAFFPAQEEGEPEPSDELIILKVIEENGEELLSTCDSDEEQDAVYDAFMEDLFDEEDE